MNSSDSSILPYRENVCLLIYNKDFKLFLGERMRESGIWQFPQGGAEKGLTLEENALKEAHEELGVSIDKFEIVCQLKHTHKYDFETPPAYAVNRFRGQSQTFWVLKYNGSDSEIDLENSDKEFSSWQWVEPQLIAELAEPKRVPGYRPAVQEFIEKVVNEVHPKF